MTSPWLSGDSVAASKRSNPYMKEEALSDRPVKTMKATPPLASSKAGLLSSLVAPPNSGSGSIDSYRKTMQEFESEVFTGKLRTTIKEFDSNAPKEMKCQLCEEACKKVRI